ncbi:MAG: flagellar filament capping protein FliD, partial [Clostridiales bacterium]|nr:flagellar filament capping protein FliD [Clostridiales bacterium]
MAANSINLTNRLTGLYSGLDTDALVNTMMQIEQLKLNRQLRSLTTMQWKQEAYNSVNTDLKTFVNDYISILGSNSMMKSSSYVAYDAEILGDRASSVKISGSANACEGTIRINSITQLAEASAATSAGKVSKNGELSELNSASLQSLDFATRLDFVDKKISFAINDVEFTFSSADSLQTMLNTVNSSGAGVTMSYSRITDAFSIESKEQGADGAVNIRNISGNAFGAGSAFGIDNGSYKNGRNALLNINGVDLEKSSNKIDIDGVNYTLISTFEEDEGPVTAVLTRNVGNAVDSVKQFVEGYNTLLNKLTELSTARKTSAQRDYAPLTEAEKADMTDEQIKKWEEIAKTGLLYNDAGISRLITNLRSAFYDTIEGLGVSPSELGLRTTS